MKVAPPQAPANSMLGWTGWRDRNLWGAKHCGDAVKHLLEDPAPHAQDCTHSEQLLLWLPLVTHLQLHGMKHDHLGNDSMDLTRKVTSNIVLVSGWDLTNAPPKSFAIWSWTICKPAGNLIVVINNIREPLFIALFLNMSPTWPSNWSRTESSSGDDGRMCPMGLHDPRR